MMTSLLFQERRKREQKGPHLKERHPQTTHLLLLERMALSRMRESQIPRWLYCGCLGESLECEGRSARAPGRSLGGMSAE